MHRNNDHWAVAGLLVGRYGEEAEAAARRRAQEAVGKGDDDAAEIWRGAEAALADDGLDAGGAGPEDARPEGGRSEGASS
jgi:hypothetical protein